MKPYLAGLNRVAETLYFLRPEIERSLGNRPIPLSLTAQLGGHANFLALWKAQYNDRFFDMGTFVRLGSETERAFRDYYMLRMGHKTLSDLRADPAIQGNIFQRVKSRSTTNLQTLYQSQLNIELEQMPHFGSVKEFIIHRHLYAHNSGLVDEQYFEDLESTCGLNLRSSFVPHGFPNQDVFNFDPLPRLAQFYEDIKKTIDALP